MPDFIEELTSFPASTVIAAGIIVITTGLAAVVLRELAKLLFGGSKPKVALDPERFQGFKLVKKIVISDDTRVFRFALDSPTARLGLPIGQHMYLKATVDGAPVQRAYTPISSDDDLGHFDLLIKVYFSNVHPKFPEGGKLSQHINRMSIGDEILVKGPTGRLEYLGRGRIAIKKNPRESAASVRTVSKIGMIAGGSGITPMMQVVRAILKDPSDKTEAFLIFGNQTADDILLRDEIEECAKDPRIHVWFTLDRPPASDWLYGSGFVSHEMITQHMCAAAPDAMVFMCGPPPMINFACKPNLEKAGFSADQMFTF